MRRLSLAEIDSIWSEFEHILDQTPEIDHWCSGLDWVLPVHHGFGAGSEPLALASAATDAPGFALLARYRLEDGTSTLAGIEPLWGFASPLVGPDIESLTAGLVGVVAELQWDHLVLPGMPELTGHTSFPARVAGELSRLGPVGLGTGIVRRVADLSDGYGPWLSRRSAHFRRNLRQAEQRAARAGVEFEEPAPGDGLFDRLLAIEARSWKGEADTGMASVEMEATYRAMVDRLGRRNRLLVTVASLEGEDVGFILGGVRAGIYRGLQLSYVRAVADLSIGHLLQHRQLRALCQAGQAHTYDLGMDIDYKTRWADRAVPTFTLVVNRHRRLPLA